MKRATSEALIWGAVLVALLAAGAEITRAQAVTRAYTWDKQELELTVEELYALQNQCCNPQGEGCDVPILGTDC